MDIINTSSQLHTTMKIFKQHSFDTQYFPFKLPLYHTISFSTILLILISQEWIYCNLSTDYHTSIGLVDNIQLFKDTKELHVYKVT